MTRILKTSVLGFALTLLATCAHEPPLGTPGTGCSNASCCYGWVWMLECMPAQPPDCGCSCKESGRLYGSREQCLADHPPDAGTGQLK